MVSSSLAHGDWLHLLGNMVFYLAFAPALEILLSNRLRFIWIMLFISFVVGISYSISIVIGSSEPLPSLGFSGVVMGMIGLSAYLMPQARIRVFWWYIILWKTFYVPAWIIALLYIALDSWEMLTAPDYGGINVVAHVAGGFAGYLFGFLWLKQRKQETREELADEIEEMKLQRRHGTSPAMSHRGRKQRDHQLASKEESRGQDRFIRSLYQRVTTHRDSEAIILFIDRFDPAQTTCKDFEALFEHFAKWGSSRFLLCLGRLIIHQLDKEKRYGRALFFIEKCQATSPQFILPDLSRTLFYAEMAIDTGKLEVARNLLINPENRYGTCVDAASCQQLMQRAQ